MVLGFAGALGAGILSSISSGFSAKQSYKYSSMLQAQQNAWMERMANTAHQREVKDLRAAGLNPILSATGGNGASTPSAGSATMSVDNPDLANTAMAYKQLKNETELKNSQKDVNNSAISLNDYLGDKAHYESAFARENTKLLQDYGPQLKKAEVANVIANTAKVTQDIINSKRLTDSQIDVNSSTAKYTRERSRGFSESHSNSSSEGWNLGITGIGSSSSESFNRSRTY